jgi:crossover junction endodeoxyribonuclease RusA
MKADRRFKDRSLLIAWIDAHPLGVTTAQAMDFQGWKSDTTAWNVLSELVQRGQLCRHGWRETFRWCTARTLPGIVEAHDRAVAAAKARRALEAVAEPAQPRVMGPRWVFDLGVRPGEDAMDAITLTLPYPVSANRYWRSFVPKGASRAVVIVSDEAKVYREEVGWIARQAGVRKPFECRVRMDLMLYPDRPADWVKRASKDPLTWDDGVRCIDLGNAEKVLSDALQGIIFDNDSRIWELHKYRMEPDSQPGRIKLVVTPLVPVTPQLDLLGVA